MKGPSPELREMFDDLHAVERHDDVAVDRAWRRFGARQRSRQRVVIGAWMVAGAATAAVVLAVLSSFGPGYGRQQLESAPEEAEYQVEVETAGGAAVRRGPARASAREGATPSVPPERGSEAVEAVDSEALPRALPSPQRPRAGGVQAEAEDTAATTGGPPSIAAELVLLDAAEQALRRGELHRAGEKLDAHRDRFPQGVLQRERKTLRARLDERRSAPPAP